ncbi:MAG TPA: hypothetical protein VEH81_11875 [Ktedonobacteraceae bacterium]|nr:hypothetical protein [Ktedonobacteraceae bacterium]
MKRFHTTRQICYPFLPLVLLTALISLGLVACTSRLESNISTRSQPIQQPTTVVGYGTAHGCPSDTEVTSSLPVANVAVRPTGANSTVIAHVGDVIEIQLPFGHKWTGPTTSEGGLQLQTPAGYAYTATKMCIWRFSAQSVGLTLLTFSAEAICEKGQGCPQYVFAVTFTIEVK